MSEQNDEIGPTEIDPLAGKSLEDLPLAEPVSERPKKKAAARKK